MEKIIQLTSGRGPEECAWVVARVLKKVLEEAKAEGLEAQVVQREPGSENGTVLTATLIIKGNGSDAFVDSWTGTIQWIGTSQFRSMHKRKNWFIGIFELQQSVMPQISYVDIKYQAMRSSGAGGQNVNKVSSAVRATHLPTGISVVAMDSRSQHQNKKTAMERLIAKLQEASLELLKKEVDKKWENQLNIVRGNPKRVFKGTDFKKQQVEKSYKSTRQQLKNNLKNEIE